MAINIIIMILKYLNLCLMTVVSSLASRPHEGGKNPLSISDQSDHMVAISGELLLKIRREVSVSPDFNQQTNNSKQILEK